MESAAVFHVGGVVAADLAANVMGSNVSAGGGGGAYTNNEEALLEEISSAMASTFPTEAT